MANLIWALLILSGPSDPSLSVEAVFSNKDTCETVGEILTSNNTDRDYLCLVTQDYTNG